MHNNSIRRSFELCIISCLKSIQLSNPSLLFTVKEMKETERSMKYIPAAAAAISSIISRSCKSVSNESTKKIIISWSNEQSIDPGNMSCEHKMLSTALETKFHHLFKAKFKEKPTRKRQRNSKEEDSFEDKDDDDCSYSSNIYNEPVAETTKFRFHANDSQSCRISEDDDSILKTAINLPKKIKYSTNSDNSTILDHSHEVSINESNLDNEDTYFIGQEDDLDSISDTTHTKNTEYNNESNSVKSNSTQKSPSDEDDRDDWW